ncbi:hypothetical protein E4U55_002471 [Claviceps digitariae]|nr:hypothetical protein E4U55_002471 [Claviceps digitariae]
MASYPSQHEINQQKQQEEEQRQEEQQQQDNEPRPLRIVKRHRSIDSRRDSEEHQHTHTSGVDSDSDVASITDGTQRLHIFKRRSRRRGVVEVNGAHKKAWGEAVASCRGLLRRSTPDMKSYMRFLSFGQASSSHTSCSSRVSSAESWQKRGSTDDGRRRQLSSISSYEADGAGAGAGAGAPVSGDVEKRHWTPRKDRDGSPQQLSPRQIARNTGGYILSPRIVVTAHNEDALGGNARVWAAVEISRKLSQISSSSSSSSSSSARTSSSSTGEKTGGGVKSSGTFVNHKIDRYFDFGCLYDLTAEVQSTQDATIVEVIQEQSWPTSEELMEELELQLGDIQTQLLSVKVSYLHSAFPTINNSRSTEDGLCYLESRMETTATAVLVRSCNDSVWASRTRGPSSSSSSQRSLFPLMVQHWGDERAIDVQRRISDSQMMFQSPHHLDFSCLGERLPVADQHAAESDWKVWSGQGTKPPQSTDEEIKTPVREIYYFGERAIQALKAPAGPERHQVCRKSSRNKHKSAAVTEPKEKDVNFWDWGKWF